MPTVPAMPPIENTTRAGTPLATQKAPFQSMARFRTFSPFAVVDVALLTDIVPSPRFKSHSGCESPAAGIECRLPIRIAKISSPVSPLARPKWPGLSDNAGQDDSRRLLAGSINDAPVCHPNLDQF